MEKTQATKEQVNEYRVKTYLPLYNQITKRSISGNFRERSSLELVDGQWQTVIRELTDEDRQLVSEYKAAKAEYNRLYREYRGY